MTFGMTYGESFIKKYPLINDNLLRVQSMLLQVIPEGLKQHLPHIVITETSDKDTKCCDIDVPKSTTEVCYNNKVFR